MNQKVLFQAVKNSVLCVMCGSSDFFIHNRKSVKYGHRCENHLSPKAGICIWQQAPKIEQRPNVSLMQCITTCKISGELYLSGQK